MTDEPNGPEGVKGAHTGPHGVTSIGHRPPGPTNVQSLRLPGATPPEAYEAALERLLEAMMLSATISREAAGAFAMMFKVSGVSAPYGQHGAAAAKIINSMTKRLEAHLATLPNHQPPGAA